MHGLKRILERLGLKQLELAKLLEVNPRTVSLWSTGEIALPGPVRAYLRLLQTAGPETFATELARLDRCQSMFEDGLYCLSYASQAGEETASGDALAVLQAGRIVGTDRWGGRFQGCYRFDTATETNHFQMRLAVPPHAELVTGLAGGSEGATVDVETVMDRAAPVSSAVIEIAGQPVHVTLTYLGPVPN